MLFQLPPAPAATSAELDTPWVLDTAHPCLSDTPVTLSPLGGRPQPLRKASRQNTSQGSIFVCKLTHSPSLSLSLFLFVSLSPALTHIGTCTHTCTPLPQGALLHHPSRHVTSHSATGPSEPLILLTLPHRAGRVGPEFRAVLGPLGLERGEQEKKALVVKASQSPQSHLVGGIRGTAPPGQLESPQPSWD